MKQGEDAIMSGKPKKVNKPKMRCLWGRGLMGVDVGISYRFKVLIESSIASKGITENLFRETEFIKQDSLQRMFRA